MGVSIVMGVPKIDGWFKIWNIRKWMIWGYPYDYGTCDLIACSCLFATI